MNEMSVLLKSKFKEFGIPEDTTNEFLKKYSLSEKGLYRCFTLETLPSDECFQTLAEYEKIRQRSDNKFLPNDIVVAKLLTIPYSQIRSVKEKIAKLLVVDSDIIDTWYNTEMIFVKEDTVDTLFEYFINKKFEQDTFMSFFKGALILGADESVKLIEAVFDLIGDHTYEIMCESLFYPCSNPIGLINYLMQHGLNVEQTAQILKDNSTLFLFFRKDENGVTHHGHNQAYIDETIKKYSK